MTSCICYNSGSSKVLEVMFLRINKLACTLNTHECCRELENATAWCEDCDPYVEIIESKQPLYAKI